MDSLDNRPLLPEFDGDARACAPDWPYLSVEACEVVAVVVEQSWVDNPKHYHMEGETWTGKLH